MGNVTTVAELREKLIKDLDAVHEQIGELVERAVDDALKRDANLYDRHTDLMIEADDLEKMIARIDRETVTPDLPRGDSFSAA